MPETLAKTGKKQVKRGKAKKTSFKPGQCGNPKGRPKLPEEIRLIATQTKQDIITAYFHLSRLTPAQAGKYKAKTVLEMGILKCFHDFTRTGRTDQMRHLWAECHGKPRESIELTGKDGGPVELADWKERLKTRLERNADNNG